MKKIIKMQIYLYRGKMTNRKKFLIIANIIVIILVVIVFTYDWKKFHNSESSEVSEVTSSETEEVDSITSNVLADLTEYNSSEYSKESPYITTDLYGMNPLSAYIAFPIDQDASFSYTVVGKDEYSDYEYTDETLQTGDLVVPIIGLYENYDNTVELTINYADGTNEKESYTVTTGNVADYITNSITVDTSSSDIDSSYQALEGGFIMDNRCNAYDINGDIRVAMEIENLDWTGNGLTINYDGSFLMGTQDYIYNISITGRILHEYKAPEGYYINHDYLSTQDGNTYVILSPTDDNMTYSESGFKNEAFIGVYKTGVDETPSEIYDINELVADNTINAISTFTTAQDELVHLNALTYDEATDTLMMSSQSQNAIIAIDPGTGEMKWIIKDPDTVSTNSDKVLEQLGDDFIQTNGQHSINVTTDEKYDDGDDSTIEITVFDNEFCFDSNGNTVLTDVAESERTSTCQTQDASTLLVYRIDTEEMTVEMLDNIEISGYYSSIRSSWFQSPDYEYNYITFADMGTLVVTDSDYNILFTYTSSEDGFIQNMYRTRIINSDQLEDIVQLENQ